MRLRTASFFILFLFLFHLMGAQTDPVLTDRDRDRANALNGTGKEEADLYRIITLFTGYRIPVYSNAILNTGHGLYFEPGFNPGYFLKRKQLIGLYCGISFRDLFWNTRFSDSFMDRFSGTFHNDYQATDSVIMGRANELIQDGHRFHEAQYTMGVMFRFPGKWSPVLKLFRGIHYWEARTGNNLTDCKEPADHCYYDLDNIRSWGGELIFWSGHKEVYLHEGLKKNRDVATHFGFLSFYFERLNSEHLSFSFDNDCHQLSAGLNSFTSAGLSEDFGHSIRLGIKLGIGFY